MEILWDLQIFNDIILQLAEVPSYREVRIDAVRTEVTIWLSVVLRAANQNISDCRWQSHL